MSREIDHCPGADRAVLNDNEENLRRMAAFIARGSAAHSPPI